MKRICRITTLVFLLVLAVSSHAQNATSPLLQQYAAQRGIWFNAVWPFAQRLFGSLALIEFAWFAARALLERSDLQSWIAGAVGKIMWIGAFYTLLIFGPTWIPTLVDSFIDLGAAAGNGGVTLTPSGIFARGIEIGGHMLDAARTGPLFSTVGTAISLVISALIVVIAFCLITVQYVVAIVESYIVVAAGVIFLGFGGSRWTVPYVERYIALAVSVGVKIFVLYLLIAVGMNISNDWVGVAQGIGNADNPAPSLDAWEIMGSALIFAMLCWQAPKLIASVLGGAPQLSGADLIGATVAPASAIASVASFGVEAVAASRLASVASAAPIAVSTPPAAAAAMTPASATGASAPNPSQVSSQPPPPPAPTESSPANPDRAVPPPSEPIPPNNSPSNSSSSPSNDPPGSSA